MYIQTSHLGPYLHEPWLPIVHSRLGNGSICKLTGVAVEIGANDRTLVLSFFQCTDLSIS